MNTLYVLSLLFFVFVNSQGVKRVNGQDYLVTSLKKSQTGDPYSLAEKYGKASSWKNILLERDGKVTKMTDALSTTIDDADILLVPLSWVPSSQRPTSNTPSSPKPTSSKPSSSTPPPKPTSPPSSGTWKKAIATYYESYPTTKEEAEAFSGDKYQGMFALFDDKKPLSWVQQHSIVAIYDKFWGSLGGKNIRISAFPDGRNAMEVQVVDMCSDKDCSGCCSANMKQAGVDFLIDLEKFTAAKFLGKSPSQVVKDGLYQTIYYSTSTASAAMADNSKTFTQTVPVGEVSVGVIVGATVGAILFVIVVVVAVVLVKRRNTEEKV